MLFFIYPFLVRFQQEKGEWEELIQMINSESEMDTDNDEELLNSLEPSSEFSSPNELLKQMNILVLFLIFTEL